MTLGIELVIGVSFLYISLLFMIAYYADKKQEQGKSIIANPYIYSLSIAVYATTWTFYGSVGKAATTGLDFFFTYLGPSLTAFSWWFLLRKIIRISKENNVTSIADFISSRYGKSQLLGAVVTIIAMLGIMPYIALQLRAVSKTFRIICGVSHIQLPEFMGPCAYKLNPALLSAIILSIFSVVFGARRLVSSERHEGLVAAIAVESIVKLTSFLIVGIFITYYMFNGFSDIFSRMEAFNPKLLTHLTTFGDVGNISYPNVFTMLFLSMGAIMLLPRQFQVMVIENSDEEHIKKAMWLFPVYMFLINIFVMPIALGGILLTGGNEGADYFVLTLPIKSGHQWISLLAFLGGFSAAAGMVMVESIAISTMFLNHILMPIVVRLRPRSWFPRLLINLKRSSIFLVVFLGYLYHSVVDESYMLVNMGLISFAAAAQFGPALIGGLYWKRGNRVGALAGIILGFLLWFYTLLLPSFEKSGWWQIEVVEKGPFGIELLKPTELFGLTGFDIWTNSLFWSMLFNIGAYLVFSIILHQDEQEKDQVRKFVDVFERSQTGDHWETKRLSKPVTIMQFVNLMSKFIGEAQACTAISDYLGNREINETGSVSEFELPKLKRFTERTLAGSLGAAAAGAIVESFLSDVGSKMEPVFDIFSTVRTSLAESREALFVRLKASEIMNRTLDLQVTMDELLELLLKEFKLDLAIVRIINDQGILEVRSHKGTGIRTFIEKNWQPETDSYIGEAFLSNTTQFINDTQHVMKPLTRERMINEGIKSFAHIPIASAGQLPIGILSVFSRSIVGLFTEQFLNLMGSLAGQLAQAIKIVMEMEAKEKEREEKESAQVENARVSREMEIAKQIQLSLLPGAPPALHGVTIACRCITASHVGGDYYDFFPQSGKIIDIVIADVSGHSVGAALIMAEMRSVLRTQVYLAQTPGKILAALNEILYEDLNNAELFITMFYIRYNAETRDLYYANAGHNRPMIYRTGVAACMELDAEGLILGINRGVEFEEKMLRLEKGDLLLMYTDGVTEAQNGTGELFGTGRLCDCLSIDTPSLPEDIIESVISKAVDFSGTSNFEDDVSLVVIKIEP